MASAWGDSWGGAWGDSWGGVGPVTPPVVVVPAVFGGHIRPKFKKPDPPDIPRRIGVARLFAPMFQLSGDGSTTRPMVTGRAKPLNLQAVSAKGEAGVAYLIDTASLIAQDDFFFGLKG